MELSKIYEELYELEKKELGDECKLSDIASREREYRRKFYKLLKLLGLKSKPYKENKVYTIPDSEAPIVKAILRLGTKKNSLAAKWLNDNQNNFSSEDIVSLYEDIEAEIRKCTNTPKRDISVHVDEWLDTLDSILNYSCSKMIVEMKQLLEELKVVTLPLNHQIDVGTLYLMDEYGNKDYIDSNKQQEFNRTFGVKEKEINVSNFKEFSSAQEYLQALNKLIHTFINDAKDKAHYTIETIAMTKDAFAADCTVDDYINSNSKEMVSSYIARDRNIYKYLRARPDAKKLIEDKTELINIDKYFDI